MNVLLMIVFIICAAVFYTCYKSAKDLEKNSKLPKAPSEDVKQEGCCGIVECGYWVPLWENGEMRQDRYYCNYKHCEMKPGAPCPFAKEQPEMLAPSIIESLMSEEWNNAK